MREIITKAANEWATVLTSQNPVSRLSVLAAAISAFAAATCGNTHAQDWQGADSPFTLGEAQPAKEASCATLKHWIARAPEVEGRVSFGITGKLTGVHWDGVLGYLIMCEEAEGQVMCVTYSVEGREVGQTISFAGGYGRAGDNRVMLDPCLASEP